MNILMIGVNYAPEPTGNAPYTTALARSLVARGHTVDVITGYPHYPDWRIPDSYTGRRMTEVIDGVTVHRYRHFVPQHGGTGLGRLLMELHFGWLSATARWGQADVVLTISPALFSSGAALLRARLTRGLNAATWVQDLYSKGTQELHGTTSGSARVSTFLESTILRLASSVTVIHPRFQRHLTQVLKVDPSRVVVQRNWAHLRPTAHSTDTHLIRAKYGWGDDEFIVLHAGNMGAKQGLSNVVEAAKYCQEKGHRIRWVLMGSGSQLDSLKKQSQGINTIEFLPPQEDNDFQDLLRSADVLLVNEKPGLREMAVPSKLTSYFFAGMPVLAAVEPDGTTAEEVLAAQAGILAKPGHPKELVEAALHLQADPQLRTRLGILGKQHAENFLAEKSAVDSYEKWLRALTPHKNWKTEKSQEFPVTHLNLDSNSIKEPQ